MIILLATVTWIFLIVLVVSLCLSARHGDLTNPTSDIEHPVTRTDHLAHDRDADERRRAQSDGPQREAA